MSARFPRVLRRRRNVVILALVVVIVGGGTAAWAATRSSSDPSATSTTTETVSSQTVSQTVSASGTIEPATEADLSFPVSGTVTSVKVAVGDKVTKGQVLARVDKSALTLAVTVAKSSLTAADEQLTSAESGSSDSQISAAKASVASAKASLATARDNLAAGDLKSTVTGTVATVNISKGDTVGSSSGNGSSGGSSSSGSSGSSSGSSSADVVVISTTSWIVNASVGSSDLASIKKGLQARITPTDATTTSFGTVKSVGIVASSSTSSSSSSASFPVVIAITGNPTGMYAGGSATVSIVVKQVSGILSVATSAVHSSAGSTYVLKLVNGKQVKTPVTIGQTFGPTTQVTKGLASGDKVVVTRTTRTGGGTGSGTGTRNGNGGGFGGGGFGGGGFGGGGNVPAGGAPAGGGAPGGAG